MRFSPILLSALLIQPLRYFFSNYAGENLKYNEDAALSKIEIGSINDFNKIPVQAKPRIMVSRGNYIINKTGLTDNLAEGKSVFETKGLTDVTNMVFIDGEGQILIQARHEGTIETIADMVSHFLIWSRPYICDTQGFSNFAIPMSVSTPEVTKEDLELFQIVVSIPYRMEEQWNVKSDALKLKGFYTTLTKL